MNGRDSEGGPRRRLNFTPTSARDSGDEGGKGEKLSTPRSGYSRTPLAGDRTPVSSRSFDYGDALLGSPSAQPISVAFKKLQDMSLGEASAIYSSDVLYKPETQFQKIVQKALEYLAEAGCDIACIRTIKDLDANGVEELTTKVGNFIEQIGVIVAELESYLEEVMLRKNSDSFINPRILNGLQSNQTALADLKKTVKESKKSLHQALMSRGRKDLLDEWGGFDRAARARDAEELISESTGRLINSKRILEETIATSSGTLGSLAMSSQAVQNNDEELHSQRNAVSSARSLMRKYGRRAQTDKLSIWLGFVFFLICALVVAYRRLFK